MYNQSDNIAALRDAETILTSTLLTDEERGVLLGSLIGSIPPSFNRPYIDTITSALERVYAPYRPTDVGTPEGVQDAAPVDTGPGEATAQAGQGTTQGLAQQAQNVGVVAGPSDSGGTPTKAASQAQRPKQSPARK